MLAAFLLYLRQFFEPMQEISPVLQHLPVGLGGAGEALRRARGGARRSPSRPTPSPLAARRGASSLRPRARSPTSRTCRCCPTSTCTSRRGRPWPWSAPPVPARRPSPSWWRGSTTRPTGAVLLDGIDLRDLSDDDLRRAVVMVTQENFLFSGSVADNIRFGRPERDRGRVVAAARAIGAARLHPRAARGLRHRRRQPRRAAQRRAAPAGRVRPGVPRRPGGADPRRGDVVAGHPVRAAGAAGAAHHPGRPDRGDHRPPALHRGDRRPGAGDGARPDRRGRPPGRPGRRAATAGSPTCTAPGSTRWPDPFRTPRGRPGPSRRRPRRPGPGRAAAACPGSAPRAS